MKGRRTEFPEGLPEPGDYYKTPAGEWYGCSPNGYLCNLTAHDVIEHPDGTITVSPSIGIRRQTDEKGRPVVNNLYHGYLEKGIWRTA